MSWFLFECPNLIWVVYCWFYWGDDSILFLGDRGIATTTSSASIITQQASHYFTIYQNNQIQLSTNILLLSLFAMHYINRAIVYPLRMNPNCQPVPLVVTLSAMMVTTLNGYLQSFYLVNVEKLPPMVLGFANGGGGELTRENLQCWLGILIFFIGMGVNIHSDGVLRNLRRYGPSENKQQQQRTYYIPQSPLFAYISCPNFFGEILEWFGFSMASQFSLPSVAFFLYTASNLIPRGIAHHEWYLIKFEDYPKERRWAVVPFIE